MKLFFIIEPSFKPPVPKMLRSILKCLVCTSIAGEGLRISMYFCLEIYAQSTCKKTKKTFSQSFLLPTYTQKLL
jgi:hypothetical protein